MALFECTPPVNRLQHSYVLTPIRGGTRLEQRMDYRLKFGSDGASGGGMSQFFWNARKGQFWNAAARPSRRDTHVVTPVA